MTTSMFHRIQNQGFRANGMSLARRVVMDHSLMATAEQYTSANNRPGRQAMDYLKAHVLNTTDYVDKEWMEFAGVADKTALEQAEYALTAPLTEQERHPKPLNYYDTMQGFGNDRYIEIEAESYAEAQQIFNHIAMMDAGSGYGPDLARVGTNDGLGFYGNFGDGLPLVPPSEELVQEMLAGSERGKYPNDVLGWLKFQGGAITVEKVAINAVMAGAKPEHFPVILAAMEMLASGWDYDKMWYHGLGTGSDSTLHIMLNGPLAEELGVSGDMGSDGGAGNEVNAVIGRAIRMCIRNIGHISLEVDDHQYKGREQDHILILFREQEELLPGWDPAKWDGDPRTTEMWVPYHVEMGFRPEESTITIWAGNSTGRNAIAGEPSFWSGASLSGSNGLFGADSFWGSAVDAGAINMAVLSPGMAQVLYEYQGIRCKDDLRATAKKPSNTVGGGNSGMYYTINPIVSGGELNGTRLYGNYSFYNRQNHQIQLITGATLTRNGRASSAFDYAHVGVTGTETVSKTVSYAPQQTEKLPAEIANAYPVGTWPLSAGSYDPALDEFTILKGTKVYGLFTSSYAKLDPPSSVSGYRQAASPETMENGDWCLLMGSSGFNYVLIRSEDSGGSYLVPSSRKADGSHLPSAPRNVNITVTAGSMPNRQNVTVTWDPPEDDGNLPIMAYQISYQHGGNIQFFTVTNAPDGGADLGNAKGNCYAAASYSVYNHVDVGGGFFGILQNSAGNRIYTVEAGTEAFNKRSFTFYNMPVGTECFFRVRAVNSLKNALELDGTEAIATSLGGSTTFFWFNDGMTARASGRGAWGLYNGGRSTVITAAAGQGETAVNPFLDVSASDYYYDAVLWAFKAEPQVTNGIDDTHFGPANTVTRGQAVTFLWRAMGCPEPSSSVNPFEDVTEGKYFYKAVLWAVEKGITNGTDDAHFTPNQTCSTAHIITFLYRTLGIGTNGWYKEAEEWARGSGLLDGLDVSVAPGVDCPRSDVVLFLYRRLGA